MKHNQSRQLTLDTAKAFATAKPSAVSSATALRRYAAEGALDILFSVYILYLVCGRYMSIGA